MADVFGLLIDIFFIGYFFFEVLPNMVMHIIGARIWIAEADFFPGKVLFLTYCFLSIMFVRKRVLSN